jgi:hypothetical protein
MSSNLSRRLEDEAIREYSPSWNLIGVSFLKTMMNLGGMENNFSKQFVESNMYSSNMSQNSYVSGFYLLPFMMSYLRTKEKNKGLMMGGVVLLVAALVIWSIVLFGVEKINLYKTE